MIVHPEWFTLSTPYFSNKVFFINDLFQIRYHSRTAIDFVIFVVVL